MIIADLDQKIISTSNVSVKVLNFPNLKGGEAIDARSIWC